MEHLRGPMQRRGRPKIEKPENRYWWKTDLYTVDPDGREYCPAPDDTEYCWFFRRGPMTQVGHMGKSTGVRKLIYEIYREKVNWVQMVVVSGECNPDCINPQHSTTMDRASFIRMQSAVVSGMRANDRAPLLEKVYVDLGQEIVVGIEAARLYWGLLAGEMMCELWDWDTNLPAWRSEIWALRKPPNGLVAQAIVYMMRDEEWTEERVRKHALVPEKRDMIVAAKREWDDFHEGLRGVEL